METAANNFLPLLGPITTCIASGVAAFIAYKFGKIQQDIAEQQKETAKTAVRTAQNKLKLDLFDRRVKIYNCMSEALDQFLSGETQVGSLANFYVTVLDAKWLFPQDVIDYIYGEFQNEMREIRNLRNELDGDKSWMSEDDVKRKEQKLEDIQQTASMKFEKLANVFKPYLALDH